MGLSMFYDEALAYLRSLTDEQVKLEKLLASIVTPNARKVFVLEGLHCGKSTFVNVLSDILDDMDFWSFSFRTDNAFGWDASSVIETDNVYIAALPESPFAVLIIDACERYKGPLPATTIAFRPLEKDSHVDDMRDKLGLLMHELLDIINDARDKHTTRLVPFSISGCIC